jgi:hypothetical protein
MAVVRSSSREYNTFAANGTATFPLRLGPNLGWVHSSTGPWTARITPPLHAGEFLMHVGRVGRYSFLRNKL